MRLYRPARRYLERCDRPTQKRLIERIEALSENPYSHSKLLENAQGKRSSRVGKLRIIFEVDEQGRSCCMFSLLRNVECIADFRSMKGRPRMSF